MNKLIDVDNFKIKFLNILFILIPLSFIVGNLMLNINIFLFIALSLFFYKNKIFEIKIIFIDKIVFFFFSYTVLVAIANYIESHYLRSQTVNFYLAGKSLFYLRYLFLYIVTRYLIEKNLLNFKWFFVSSSCLCLFVSLDIFYQFIFNKDIFGFVLQHSRKISGPFGSELIAGGYLQRFFVFFVFLILGFFPTKKNFLLIIVFIAIIFTATILSGNRMPFVLLLLIILLIAIFEKKIRFLLIISLSIFFLIFYFVPKKHDIKANIGNFTKHTSELLKLPFTRKIDRNKLPNLFQEFESFYDTWLMNKYIGGGIRSFRINCPNRNNININERVTCNTHPHNYYLEILTDLGLIGLVIISILFFFIFYNSFIKKYFLKTKFLDGNILTPFIFIFIAEVFPIKSSGSFFTTLNSTFLFLIISIIVGLSQKKLR